MTLEYTQHIRRPFQVEAVEITEENIEEIAAKIGDIRTDASGKRYIAIDRRVIPFVPKAQVGWLVTRLGENYRCYAPGVFEKQFEEFAAAKTYVFTPIGEVSA